MNVRILKSPRDIRRERNVCKSSHRLDDPIKRVLMGGRGYRACRTWAWINNELSLMKVGRGQIQWDALTIRDIRNAIDSGELQKVRGVGGKTLGIIEHAIDTYLNP